MLDIRATRDARNDKPLFCGGMAPLNWLWGDPHYLQDLGAEDEIRDHIARRGALRSGAFVVESTPVFFGLGDCGPAWRTEHYFTDERREWRKQQRRVDRQIDEARALSAARAEVAQQQRERWEASEAAWEERNDRLRQEERAAHEKERARQEEHARQAKYEARRNEAIEAWRKEAAEVARLRPTAAKMADFLHSVGDHAAAALYEARIPAPR